MNRDEKFIYQEFHKTVSRAANAGYTLELLPLTNSPNSSKYRSVAITTTMTSGEFLNCILVHNYYRSDNRLEYMICNTHYVDLTRELYAEILFMKR